MADPVTEISDRNGVSEEEALFYLQEFKWDFNSSMEACRNQTLSPFTDDDESSPESPSKTTDSVWIPNPPEKQEPPPQSRNELSRRFAEAIDGTTPHDAVEYLTRSNWNRHVAVGEFLDDSREMIGWMDFDKTESLKEAAEALMAVSQANVESRTIQETSVCKEFTETLPMVIDWNQLPRPREQRSQLNDILIDSFLGFVGGATREEAITCLKLCDWDVNEAAYYFFDHPSPGVFSEEETVKAMEMNWQDNRGNQGEIGNSSSSLNADPTETGRPFNEAGLVNVHVAVSGIARSQVLKNWNSEAVDEDPSTETGPDRLATQDMNIVEPRAEPMTTEITFQVLLVDGRNGTEEFMTFRSDETVRDIRNRIAELRPDDNRDYYLTSLDDEIYEDLNTTVQRIHSRGATKLLQVLSDS